MCVGGESEAENLGGQGGLESPHFSIRGAEPPKIGGCHEERIKY